MSRILTGIQSSKRPHLGNILGAVEPAIRLSHQSGNECLYFIADLHTLTGLKDPEERRTNTYSVAATWLAFGFDTDRNIFYRQSDVPQCCELAWILSCFAPFPMLANAHSFKDKSDKLSDVNVGLFTYPVLMAADILLYDAEIIPVGKDQQQHVEITRDLASSFNHQYGETFVIPEAKIDTNIMTIPGTDGQKMSKSYNNYIDIFLNDKELKKQVATIVTDSTPLEEPKNPDTCNVFKLYSVVADKDQIADLRAKYLAGNFGYGHAKAALLEVLIEKYKKERELFHQYMNNTDEIERKLKAGAEKAGAIADHVLAKVRATIGF